MKTRRALYWVLRPLVLFVALAAIVGHPGVPSGTPEVVESDNPEVLRAMLKVHGNYFSTVATKGTVFLHLSMRDREFSCDAIGEYGGLGGYKSSEPLEFGTSLMPEDAEIGARIRYVHIGRGCTGCFYNEFSASLMLEPLRKNKLERLKNWQKLPCGEMLRKLEDLGFSKHTVTRFATILELTIDGDNLPWDPKVPRNVYTMNGKKRP